MANKVTSNPITIDDFSADIVLSTTPISIKGINFYSATAADHLSIEDKDGFEIIHLLACTSFTPAAPVTLNNPPYTVDVSDGSYAASARAQIYL
jgi:hypothetical protein